MLLVARALPGVVFDMLSNVVEAEFANNADTGPGAGWVASSGFSPEARDGDSATGPVTPPTGTS
jgi:hypothetical protein